MYNVSTQAGKERNMESVQLANLKNKKFIYSYQCGLRICISASFYCHPPHITGNADMSNLLGFVDDDKGICMFPSIRSFILIV